MFFNFFPDTSDNFIKLLHKRIKRKIYNFFSGSLCVCLLDGDTIILFKRDNSISQSLRLIHLLKLIICNTCLSVCNTLASEP